MALTLVPTSPGVHSFGDRKARFVDITFDNSYVTGGYSLVGTDVGFSTQISLCLVTPAGGRTYEYDYAAKKLKVLYPAGPHSHVENTAVSYAQNASTSNNNAAGSAEAPNGSDQSAVTARALLIGY